MEILKTSGGALSSHVPAPDPFSTPQPDLSCEREILGDDGSIFQHLHIFLESMTLLHVVNLKESLLRKLGRDIL